MSMDELKELELQVGEKYGFRPEEIKTIMKHKPTFLFYEDDNQKGMKALENYFVKTYGYDYELVKTIVVKYPHILSKTTEELDSTFNALAENGVDRNEAIKLIFECPKLLSVQLDA